MLTSAVPTFNTSSFITTYFPVPFFAVLLFGYKIVHRTKLRKPEEMDFVTGCSDQVFVKSDEEVPTTLWGKLKYQI
jgi:amino acid transporter